MCKPSILGYPHLWKPSISWYCISYSIHGFPFFTYGLWGLVIHGWSGWSCWSTIFPVNPSDFKGHGHSGHGTRYPEEWWGQSSDFLHVCNGWTQIFFCKVATEHHQCNQQQETTILRSVKICCWLKYCQSQEQLRPRILVGDADAPVRDLEIWSVHICAILPI